jgi:hypothetical protein
MPHPLVDLLGEDMEEDTALPPLPEAMAHHRPLEDTVHLPLVDPLYVPLLVLWRLDAYRDRCV